MYKENDAPMKKKRINRNVKFANFKNQDSMFTNNCTSDKENNSFTADDGNNTIPFERDCLDTSNCSPKSQSLFKSKASARSNIAFKDNEHVFNDKEENIHENDPFALSFETPEKLDLKSFSRSVSSNHTSVGDIEIVKKNTEKLSANDEIASSRDCDIVTKNNKKETKKKRPLTRKTPSSSSAINSSKSSLNKCEEVGSSAKTKTSRVKATIKKASKKSRRDGEDLEISQELIKLKLSVEDLKNTRVTRSCRKLTRNQEIPRSSNENYDEVIEIIISI